MNPPHASHSHLDAIRNDAAYADILTNWDATFYAKYTDTLASSPKPLRILDVGCGVGQVVGRLLDAGYETYGVDVAPANIERASRVSPHCVLYDGQRLPFPEQYFGAVGALNVLEHVMDPEQFLAEMHRVTAIGGRIVISSPNFYRVLGFRDYHPRMRGLRNKWENWQRLQAKRRLMRTSPDQHRFDRMQPIIKEPFTPDDDAIVATNLLEIEFRLRQLGCAIVTSECTDRYVNRFLARALNATPLRYLMFNAFVVARRLPA